MIYKIITTKKWQEEESTTIDHSNFAKCDGRTSQANYTVNVMYKENEMNKNWKEERSFTSSDELLDFIQTIVSGLDLGEASNFKFLTDLHNIFLTINK